MLKGTIVKNISNSYTISSNENLYVCTPRGKFRKENKTPLVGDECIIDEQNNYILELLPRKNELKRPNVCNVDLALIVTSLKHPDLSTILLDKEISTILLSKIKPIICFTKIDLLTKEEKKEFEELKKYYEEIGIPCFINEEQEKLEKYLQGNTVVLTGQSGAGKSTLINKLAPNLNLKTDEISSALNRGKHTTRHTEIFVVNKISFVDTPGFSSLNLEEYPKEKIKESMLEFQNYPCKYKDCMHQKEPNCGVKKAVEEKMIRESRYISYQKMLERE